MSKPLIESILYSGVDLEIQILIISNIVNADISYQRGNIWYNNSVKEFARNSFQIFCFTLPFLFYILRYVKFTFLTWDLWEARHNLNKYTKYYRTWNNVGNPVSIFFLLIYLKKKIDFFLYPIAIELIYFYLD